MSWRVYDSLSVAAVVVVAVLALYLYPALPDPMPTHWNAAGEVDGWMPKTIGVLVMIAIPLVAFLVVKVTPLISPRGFRMDRFRDVVDILALAITATLAGIAVVTLLAASGRDVPVGVWASVLIGALLVVLGNYLGKVRRNFFVGIRTPWTLASDEVWARTHRVGGWLFMLAGLATIASAAAPATMPFMLVAAIGGAAIVSVVYSFVLYRKLHGFGERGNGAGS